MALAWLLNLGFGARPFSPAVVTTFGPPVPTRAFTTPRLVISATVAIIVTASTEKVG